MAVKVISVQIECTKKYCGVVSGSLVLQCGFCEEREEDGKKIHVCGIFGLQLDEPTRFKGEGKAALFFPKRCHLCVMDAVNFKD